MKSITIHNIDDQLEELINNKSKEYGLSLNKTIKILLKNSLGLKINKKENDFSDLLGIWDENDEKLFNKNIEDLNTVNPEDWE